MANAYVDCFVTCLQTHAEQRPAATAYSFWRPAHGTSEERTYAELERSARRIAVALSERARPGDRAALIFTPGLAFVEAFYGCLFAGVVAVPLPMPTRRQVEMGSSTLTHAMQDAEIRLLLTRERFRESCRDAHPQLASADVTWLVEADLESADPNLWKNPGVSGETLALLQYTSGSTGSPKGVRVHHRNAVANQACISEAYKCPEGGSAGGWLPMFHDMGLVGLLLHPMYRGYPSHLLSPSDFLKQPGRWLELISRHGITVSPAPTFGYEYCAERATLDPESELDLSRWSCAIVGAEPVRPGVLERFCERFSPVGFSSSAFQPSFGMAEFTLMATSGSPGGGAIVRSFDSDLLSRGTAAAVGERAPQGEIQGCTRLVSCGTSAADHDVLIVSPQTHEACEAGSLGEVWLSGPSAANGYWRKPELTKEVFEARTRDGRGPFLRTGDWGFVSEGNLFIAGRLKDTIIVRGRQIHPEDLEITVKAAHPALSGSACAAFGWSVQEQELVVVVAEVSARKNENWDVVMRELRTAVVEAHQVAVQAVSLVVPRSLPRTSSGKLQRRACKSMFSAGELRPVAEWRMATAEAEA
jgi:acyl-CoA synthetase (AMP-forming)/AMP-acid ligase II